MNESKKRSLTKTITWRIAATLITWAVAYYYTGSIGGSLKLTLVAAAISMAGYYVHERIWNKIDWA